MPLKSHVNQQISIYILLNDNKNSLLRDKNVIYYFWQFLVLTELRWVIITRVPSNAMNGKQLKASVFTCVIPGLGWLVKLWLSPHGLQLVTEHHSEVSHTFYCCLALKRQEEKCQAWYVLYLELAQCHFFNTLLVKIGTGFVDVVKWVEKQASPFYGKVASLIVEDHGGWKLLL